MSTKHHARKLTRFQASVLYGLLSFLGTNDQPPLLLFWFIDKGTAAVDFRRFWIEKWTLTLMNIHQCGADECERTIDRAASAMQRRHLPASDGRCALAPPSNCSRGAIPRRRRRALVCGRSDTAIWRRMACCTGRRRAPRSLARCSLHQRAGRAPVRVVCMRGLANLPSASGNGTGSHAGRRGRLAAEFYFLYVCRR